MTIYPNWFDAWLDAWSDGFLSPAAAACHRAHWLRITNNLLVTRRLDADDIRLTYEHRLTDLQGMLAAAKLELEAAKLASQACINGHAGPKRTDRAKVRRKPTLEGQL